MLFRSIVGSFEESYKPIMDELEKAGTVRYHGYQTDVRKFYRMAHCVVLPSYHEGMSNVLLEAAASGRPIITTDVPGCREAVVDGESGFFCKARDADSLFTAMERFAMMENEMRAEMGQRGRMVMGERFEKSVVVRETMRWIEK